MPVYKHIIHEYKPTKIASVYKHLDIHSSMQHNHKLNYEFDPNCIQQLSKASQDKKMFV